MSMFQGVESVRTYLSKHLSVYPCEKFNEETKRIDGANRLTKELTSQNVLEALENKAPDLVTGLKKVEKIVGLLGRAGGQLGSGTDLLVAFGFKEKRIMQEFDELSKNISLVNQEIAKSNLLTRSTSTSLWRFWMIHDKVLSAVLHFEQSVHDHHPLPKSDTEDRETYYCKRLGHMVRDYSPTQVINDLLLMHSIIMGEAGFDKPLFKQLAEEAYTLENEQLDRFLGPFFFFFQSVVALQVRAMRMLLSFIMYEQEDALYENDLVAIASNVVLQLGERSNPVSYYHWYINFKAFGKQNALIVSVKWPGWYVYMAGDAIGNLQGCKGHPGDQGIFEIEPHNGSTFTMTTRRWEDYYVYMDRTAFKNVRACKGDPGNQGYWKFNFKDIRTRTFTLTTVEYPNCPMHMALNSWGNLSGKRGNLDDSCYFKLCVEPVRHGADGFELAVPN